MSIRVLVAGAVVVIAVAVSNATPVSAQLCVDDLCVKCGNGNLSHQGMAAETGSEYSIECPTSETSWCVACHPELVSEFAAADQALLDAIKAGATDGLLALVNRHRDRLLLSTEQHLIVVQGNGCDADAFNSVIFLPEKVEEHIAALRLRSLEKYLIAEE